MKTFRPTNNIYTVNTSHHTKQNSANLRTTSSQEITIPTASTGTNITDIRQNNRDGPNVRL